MFIGAGTNLSDRIMANWMQFSTSTLAGTLICWAAQEATSALVVTQDLVPGISLFGTTGAGNNEVLVRIQKALVAPNFMGIPFYTAKESRSRKIDVSESLTIVQSEKQVDYCVDNAVPRLMEYSYDCYIRTFPIVGELLDGGLIVKPSILLQEELLDSMAKSRVPGWLKTSNGVFKLVQITSLVMEKDPSSVDSTHVQISFREYKPIQLKHSLATIQQLALEAA